MTSENSEEKDTHKGGGKKILIGIGLAVVFLLLAFWRTIFSDFFSTIDDRVDVSNIETNSNKSISASCAMNHADNIINKPDWVGLELEIVKITVNESLQVRDELQIMDFDLQFYSLKSGKSFTISRADFKCFSSQKAMDMYEDERKKRAIEDEKKRKYEAKVLAEKLHQEALEFARKQALREKEEAAAAILDAKRANELQAIRDAASAEIAAQQAAEKAKQWKANKIKAESKAKAERIRREKYDPIAKRCLEEAIASDFKEFLKTVRRPSAMKIGSNQTIIYKAVNKRLKEYSVSEGVISVQYYYSPTLFYVSKRTGAEKAGSSWRGPGTFTCEIDSK